MTRPQTDPGNRVPKQQIFKRLRYTLVYVPFAVFLIVLPHLSAGGSQIIAVLQAVLPLLCLATVAAAMIVLVRGKRFLALLLGISTMASLGPGYLSHYDSGIQRTSADKSACEPGPELSVLSLNVGRGRASIAELGSYIQREAPDVLVLLETNEAMILGLQASVSGWDYTHRTSPVIHGGSVDSVILSRAPLRQETNAVSQSARVLFDLPVARIDDPRLGSLRVVAVHPMPPTHDPVMWAHTLENLRLWHETQGDMPLIMAGDFNATHAHREFRDVSQGLSDVSPRIGPLQLPSWPADASLPAFAAIDHVLVRELLEVNSERFSVDGTDHHGIFTRLARCE